MEDLSQLLDPGTNSFWNLLLAIGLIVISVILARIARRAIRRNLRKYDGLEDYAGAVLGRVAGWIVVLLGVVLALAVLGVDMVPWVLLLVLVVAFLALSGRSLVENWAAGLLLQVRGPFHPGDRIESVGYVGYVETTNVRSVVIRTGDGQIVHIPNVDVLQNPIVNRTGDEGRRRSSIDFGVAPGTDLDAAEQALTDAAASVPDVYAEPAPSAWVASLGDSTVTLELRFWHDHAARHTVRSAVTHESLAHLAAAGVTAFPKNELSITGSLEQSVA